MVLYNVPCEGWKQIAKDVAPYNPYFSKPEVELDEML